MGFPYAFIICFMCFSLVFLLRHETKEINLLTDRRFRLHILDPLTRPLLKSVFKLLVNLVASPWNISRYSSTILDVPSWQLLLLLASTYYGAAALALASIVAPYLMALALIFYFMFAVSVATIRIAVRDRLEIAGSASCDFFVGVCLPIAFAMQIEAEVIGVDGEGEEEEDEAEERSEEGEDEESKVQKIALK